MNLFSQYVLWIIGESVSQNNRFVRGIMFISIVTGLTVFIQEISNQTILSVTSQRKTSKYMELWFIVLTGTCSTDQLWFPDVLAWMPEKRSFSQVRLLNVANTRFSGCCCYFNAWGADESDEALSYYRCNIYIPVALALCHPPKVSNWSQIRFKALHLAASLVKIPRQQFSMLTENIMWKVQYKCKNCSFRNTASCHWG